MRYAADEARFQEPAWVSAPDSDTIPANKIAKAAKAVATAYAPLLAKAINDEIYCIQDRAFIAELQKDGGSAEQLEEYLHTVISEALTSLGLVEAA